MQEGGYRAKNGAKDSTLLRGSGAEAGDDFPMVCETCLGHNPCPTKVFDGKLALKACLNDMKYGLPVGVRDKLLKEDQNQVAMPHSDVGQRFYFEHQAQLQASGQLVPHTMSNDMLNVAPSNQMMKFAKIHQAKESSRTAFRNLPKLCSFWVGGGCMRVKRKVCPFRPCCGTFVFPELASTNKDLMCALIKQLEEDGADKTQTNLSAEVKAAFKESGKGNKEQAIRKRVHGDDDLTAKYLGRMESMKGIKLDPPSDPTITSLWVGNLLPDITQQDLRDVFYAYGHIQSVHIVPQSKCAFVDYGDRSAAEHAASQLHNNCVVKGRPLTINWAKPRAQALCGSGGSDEAGIAAIGNGGVMLPPGVKDVAAFNLQAHMLVSPPPPPPSNASNASNTSSTQPAPPPSGPAPGFSYLPVAGLNSAPAPPLAKKARPNQPTYAAMDPSQLGSKY